MKPNNSSEPGKSDQTEFELSEKELDQVSGGFNPQPDPPGRLKFGISPISKALPAVQYTLPAVQLTKKG